MKLRYLVTSNKIEVFSAIKLRYLQTYNKIEVFSDVQ